MANLPPLLHTTATFSPCRRWRYTLHRVWDAEKPLLAVIGLNPSTADETKDDPTVRRCQGYASRWGMGGLVMLNIFGYRATDPTDMKAVADPVGPDNDEVLRRETAGRLVLCAWGAHGTHHGRAAGVLTLLHDRELHCLGTTASGMPKHPLYLRADLEPVRYHGPR